MFGRSPFSSEETPDGASEPLFRNGAAPQAPAANAAARPAPPAARPPEPASASAPASRPRAGMSSLSAAFRFEGDISGEADLQLDGEVKGDIRVARLVIGPGGRVEGAVRAHHVEVRGTVVGSIEAQAVFLYENAHVEGDITPGRLSIEGGAHFDGRVQPLRADKAEVAATRPAEPVAASPVARPASAPAAAPAVEAPRLRPVEASAAPAVGPSVTAA